MVTVDQKSDVGCFVQLGATPTSCDHRWATGPEEMVKLVNSAGLFPVSIG